MTTSLDALRQRIREIEGAPATPGVRSRSSVSSGPWRWPSPGLAEVVGPPGSGRTRLVAEEVARRTSAGERVAWIDPARTLHPPTLQALGVSLEHVLLVRPPETQVPWAVDQVLRSACFAWVVLGQALGDAPGVGRRWLQGARHGRCTLVVVGDRPSRGLPADLRVRVKDGQAMVQRQRGGGQGRTARLPGWPADLDPWVGGGGVPWRP